MAVGLFTIQDPYFTLNPYIMLHKFILLLAINLGMSISIIWSQTLEDRIKTSYAPLAPYTPTGILYDRSPLKFLMVDSLAPEVHSPGSPVIGTRFRFESLYAMFYHASFSGAPFMNHPNSVPRLIDSMRLGYDESTAPWPQLVTNGTYCDVVMGSMIFNYNKIHPQAFFQNFIYLNASDDKFYLRLNPYQITDTIWISGQPGVGSYTVQTFTITPDTTAVLSGWKTQQELFSFASLTPYTTVEQNAPVRYYFPAGFNLSNIPGHQLEVDFQDGFGFVLVLPGQLKSIIYSESGVKVIRARVKNAQGQILGDLPATTFVSVVKARFSSDLVFTSATPTNCNTDLTDSVGQALLSFKYATASNGKLMNPFILVEGFESKEFSTSNPELDNQIGSGFGVLNWISFTSGLNHEDYPQLFNLPIVVDSLLSLGYDVGYVDFRTNRAKIQKNANALISLIEQVQNELQQNFSNNGVQLMGASMGGVIARVALVKLEQSNCCHPVKNYFSFSAPHRGANIPIAAQHLTHDLGMKFNYLNIFQRSKLNYDNVLNSPAARQMLIVHRESSARTEHLAFYQYLDLIGQPENIKKIAITDGSLSAYLHRLDNSDLHSPVLADLQNIFDFGIKLPAPTKVLTIFDVPVSKFTIATAKGKAIEHSPNSVSTNWIYAHGIPAEDNLDALWNQYKKWFFSVIEYATIELVHQTAIYFLPQYTVPINASRQILTGLSESRNELVLNQRYQNNLTANNILTSEFLHHASEGLDNSPGDFNNTVEGIRKPFQEFSPDFAFTTSFPTASFVASKSALGESVSTRSILLSQNQSLILSQFDYGWAKIDHLKNEYYNNAHVLISGQFMNWLTKTLNRLNSSNPFPNDELIADNYNLGIPVVGNVQQTYYYSNQDFVPSLKIRHGASLQFNRMLSIGLASDVSQIFPMPNSSLTSFTRNLNCTPVLVQNEGTIELGEPATSPFTNSAHVQFRAGSTLELFSNSTLNIHQGSRLTIDSGATLIIHPDATVYLEGNTSVLEIKGRVIFLPNASLELTGGGYVLINQDSNQVANIYDLWEAQGSAEIRFIGQQSSQRLFEFVTVTRLSPRIKFHLQTGRINMHNGVVLDLFGDVQLQQIQMQSVANHLHRGIYLHGQPNVILNNLTVSGGEHAITSTMIQYRNPLNLVQCNFVNNHAAVTTYGGQVNFTGTTFSWNTNGWLAYDMDGNSRVEECQFISNQVAIDIMGQHDANLYITQTVIEQNVWGIKSFGQLYCRMNCSSVSNNTTGIYAGNYQWLLGGRSRNKFQNNQLAIRVEEVDNLFVFEGENDFSGSQMYLSGTFSGIAMNYLHLNPMTNGYELNVKDNRLPVVAGNTRVHLRDWNDNPIFLHNYSPTPAYLAICESNQTVAFEDYVLQNYNSSLMVTMQQGTFPLNQAVSIARSLITTNELQNTKTDLEAIELFDFILSQIRNENSPEQITSQDYVILEIALNKMMEAHNNAYRFDLIPRVRAVDDVPKNIYLTAILAEIDFRISAEFLNSTSDKLVNSLLLAKAQLYRTAEHYDYALETLQELKLSSDYFWRATADYWECISTAESKLIKETIEAEYFEKIRLECSLLGPVERRQQPAMTGDAIPSNQEGLSYTLFPNPAMNIVYLRSNELIGKAKVEIMDLTGRILMELNWPDRGDVLELNLVHVKSGSYIARIIAETSVQSVRFVKL